MKVVLVCTALERQCPCPLAWPVPAWQTSESAVCLWGYAGCVSVLLLLCCFCHSVICCLLRTCRGTDARNAEPEQKTKTTWTSIKEVIMKFRNVFCVDGWWTDCLLLITCQIILAGLAPGAMLRGHSQGPVFVFDKQQKLWLERRRRVRAACDKLC